MITTRKWLKQKEKWSELSVCARCGSVYKEIENIGHWDCSFHPGLKVEGDMNRTRLTSIGKVNNPKYVWSCCNREWSSNHERGCIPCDHTEGYFIPRPEDTVQGIGIGFLKELSPLSEAIVETEPGVVSIKRTK